jgi:hypothetical protein
MVEPKTKSSLCGNSSRIQGRGGKILDSARSALQKSALKSQVIFFLIHYSCAPAFPVEPMSKFLRAVFCLALLALASIYASAQLSTATAFGSVTDASGAEIPNATVIFTQTATNFTRTTRTNGTGEYRAEFLPVGSCTVKVNATGFRETLQNGVVLTVNQQATLNFSLQTGAEDTVVTVTSEAPLLNAGDSVIGKTEWFDTSAYCRIGTTGCSAGGGPSGLDGLIRVNSLDGPGLKDVDASLFRDFAINERFKFQFRGEATNVFNFVNLNNPGGTLSSASSFGVITGATPMRVLQVGARLLF